VHRLPGRPTALLLAMTLLAIGLLAAPPVHAEDAPPLAQAPALAWGRCTDAGLAYSGLQCAVVVVERDHDDPTGPTIRLALSRRVHTSSSYQGVMLVNPGGPGNAGRDLASLGDYVPNGAGDGFDWIGFDPRGTGASSPALRCSTTYWGTDRPTYTPRTTATTAYWLHKSKAYADACADTATKRALLPHLTTVDSVRDMESIREALGAATIGFYGYSYGTYLGQVYATMFPSRVGRFVLDGVVNPSRTWYASNLDQDRAFGANLDEFWRYVATYPRTFHLGTRWRAVKRGYQRELRRLERHPAARGRLGPSELVDALSDAGYYVYNWPELARDWSLLVRKGQGGPLLAKYHDSFMGDDSSYAGYLATECTDAPWPGWTQVRKDATAMNAVAPFMTWSNTWFNGPCLFWRAPRHARPAVSGAAVTSKILLISETRDAATPYSGALAVRGLFPSASLVAGVGGTTHASSMSGVACVDNTVASYLLTGVVPARLSGTRADRACPRLQPASPRSAGLRTTARLPGR
jgi:pimeloyl-ACP methyl ester carboxylesterase